MPGRGIVVPSLLSISLDVIGENIHRYEDLTGIAEELAVELFQKVLDRGKLTPRVLQAFKATGHDLLLQRIKAMNLHDTPVLASGNTSNRWLGDDARW